MRGLGSDNIDYRLRHADFAAARRRAAGSACRSPSLSKLERVLVVGSFLRKDHPLFAQRLRQARARAAPRCMSLHALRRRLGDADRRACVAPPSDWLQALAEIAAAIGASKGVAAPGQRQCRRRRQGHRQHRCSAANARPSCSAMPPRSIRKPRQLLALAHWIAAQTGASVGYLTEAANTVGAQLVARMPGQAA